MKKIQLFDIIPECHGDTFLIEKLGFRNPNHQSGIGHVANVFKENFKKQFAIGIIDNDKRKPRYFQKFELIEETEDLLLKKHPLENHYTIIINPALEKFLIKTAETIPIDMTKYGFNDYKELGRLTKDMNVSDNITINSFIDELIAKEAPSLIKIQTWVNELRPQI